MDASDEPPTLLPELIPIIFSFLAPQFKATLLEAMLACRPWFDAGLPRLYADISFKGFGGWDNVAELAEKTACDVLKSDKFRYTRVLRLGGDGFVGPIKSCSRAGKGFMRAEDTVEAIRELLEQCVNLRSLAFEPSSDDPTVSDAIFATISKLPVTHLDLLTRHRGLVFGPAGTTLPNVKTLTLHKNDWRLSFHHLMAGSVDGLAFRRQLPSLESWALISDAAAFDSPECHPSTWYTRLFEDSTTRGGEPRHYYSFRSRFVEGQILITVSLTSKMLKDENQASKVFPEVLRTLRAYSSPAKLDVLELVDVSTELAALIEPLAVLPCLRFVRPKFGLAKEKWSDVAGILAMRKTRVEMVDVAGILAASESRLEMVHVEKTLDEPARAELEFWKELADCSINFLA